MNIVYVCHGDLTSQSTYHVLSIAEQLCQLGHECVVCVSEYSESDRARIRDTHISICGHREALQAEFRFADGNRPSLVHCWTPRERVRQVTEQLASRAACPYFVHLEDNEREILHRELDDIGYEELAALPADEQDAHIRNPDIRIHPARHWQFLERAAGCTVLIERLKDHVPDGVPVQLFWPGYDDYFAPRPGVSKANLRAKYGIGESKFVVLYSGAFHEVNHDEISAMVTALKILVNRGLPLCFVKTGHNAFQDLLRAGVESGWVKDLGFLPRSDLSELYAIADVALQPGKSDPFNDYRFPSKLPEALVSGVPVILPQTNLGLILRHGEQAMISKSGSMEELIDQILFLYENPQAAAEIGRNGTDFAAERLSWKRVASSLNQFYHQCLSASREGLAMAGLIQDRQTDYKYRTSNRGEIASSLRGAISPQDIYRLFIEERKFEGGSSVLANIQTYRGLRELRDLAKVLSKTRKKVRKYKLIVWAQVIVISALLVVYFNG